MVTGDEDSKFGVKADGVTPLVTHIVEECPHLEFKGLMAMGKVGDVTGFREMVKLKQALLPDLITRKLMRDSSDFELSMGTSQDYELAVAEGATEVRLGTTIFGARDYKYSKPN